jgi:hypothetical protein
VLTYVLNVAEAWMRHKAIKVEAERLLNEFGPMAYEKAVAAERAARRKRDKRLATFLAEVVRRIAIEISCRSETATYVADALPSEGKPRPT